MNKYISLSDNIDLFEDLEFLMKVDENWDQKKDEW